jgi:hypothetical protein
MRARNFYKSLITVLAAVWVSSTPMAQEVWPPDYLNIEALRTLKAEKFAVPDMEKRSRLAQSMIPLLANTDPEIRDGIAFEAYVFWMRGQLLPSASLRSLMNSLQRQLQNSASDPEGVGKPFAALVLAELARTDRVAAWMTVEERQHMLKAAKSYLADIRDYRGFSQTQGWRHGVAHSADWLMQLALNPATNQADLSEILEAVASQVSAHGGHAYVYGEPDRLAVPVFHIARRKLHSPEEWEKWLRGVSQRPAGVAAADVFKSAEHLAWRHNVQAFLQALYVKVTLNTDAEVKARLLPAMVDALKRIP